ncbi:uncharacterized protein BO97DRAFT_78912 [Aspergillus homomorphus CBS 101889]|uniref:Uncharacterized protein n=1 Tax=Aspergillus homomorphus (strain CBS 101889) TaxID=1450537 RepID=A0A395ICM6_ASPHC|nr:hypothetical protein BO97DRAFT_78912 [Aspergillus homomorphus CBS 101889]RAL16903.1 hypothetical protein BO97DRAFT_78912 [Aspergillus homomorphus CBS 101889]
MTSVSFGQAEDEYYPAWPQGEVTDYSFGLMGFSSIYNGTDLSSSPLGGYCDPMVIGDRQGELLAPPSTIMTDTAIGDNREPPWPQQYPNLFAPNNLLPMEVFAGSQSHPAIVGETPTLTTAALDSQVPSLPIQSL